MNALLELLNRLAVWLDAWLRQRRTARQQAGRDQLEDDPAGWYQQHFGGVRDSSEPPDTDAKSANADDTEPSE